LPFAEESIMTEEIREAWDDLAIAALLGRRAGRIASSSSASNHIRTRRRPP